jgi:hypothetical protein
MARHALDRVDQPYVIATLNPIWMYGEENKRDDRSVVRENEILNRCNRIILFTTPSTKTLDAFQSEVHASKVRTLERGATPVKKRRKGKVMTD